MTSVKKQPEQKTVIVRVRYAIRTTGAICYRVRNGEQKEYCVTLFGGRWSCECEAFTKGHGKHQCYHVTHCKALEDARTEQKTVQPVARPVASGKASRHDAPGDLYRPAFSILRQG